MPSLGSILTAATSGLRAQQLAVEVTSHNIANANTEGYTRQRAVLESNRPLVTPEGVLGTGVSVTDVARRRDDLADADYRGSTGMAARHGARHDFLGRVEDLLGTPGDMPVFEALDAFFSSWSDLATEPTSGTARTMVLESARGVTDELRRLDAALEAVRVDSLRTVSTSVERVNALAAEVARLNGEVVSAEAGGRTASDLRDARGRALDELATLVDVQVFPQRDGSARVAVAGYGLVDGTGHGALETDLQGQTLVVRGTRGGSPLALRSGSVAGLLQVANQDVPDAIARLDAVAAGLVAEVNAVHATGTNPAGDTGVAFFDPAGVEASSIAVSATVRGDKDQVAAGTGTSDPTPLHRSGANDVALALAALRDAPVAGLSGSFGEDVAGLASEVGAGARSAREAAEAQDVMVQRAYVRREATAGVSLDEEMTDLIRFQAAYSAAARVITTADEMLGTLLSI